MVTAVIIVGAAAASWAAATVCTLVPANCTPVDTRVAVASNFYYPAQDMVAQFQGQGKPGYGTCVQVCHNSTGALLTEINNNLTYYGMFFAANATAPESLQSSTGNTAYLYAKGIPVFFGYRDDVTNVGGLITGLGSGYNYELTTTDLSSYAINTGTAGSVAVAGTAAPYGVKSHSIINSIEGTSLPGTIPGWVQSPLYDNIDLTFSAVGTGSIKSGFVSKAQICDIYGDIAYVQFTSSDYILNQKAILLDSSNSVASDLNNYVQDEIENDGWDDFLIDHCYGTF
jgi:molybdate transport system substrate-binding protein